MKLQIIKHKTGYIGVMLTPTIKEADSMLINNEIFVLTCVQPIDTIYNKIICTTTDIKLEGIPLMRLEEDVEELSKEVLPDRGRDAMAAIRDVSRMGFILGYNHHKSTHPYSLEDIKKAMQWAVKSHFRNDIGFDDYFNQSRIPKFITIESKDGVPVLENGYVKILSKE